MPSVAERPTSAFAFLAGAFDDCYCEVKDLRTIFVVIFAFVFIFNVSLSFCFAIFRCRVRYCFRFVFDFAFHVASRFRVFVFRFLSSLSFLFFICVLASNTKTKTTLKGLATALVALSSNVLQLSDVNACGRKGTCKLPNMFCMHKHFYEQNNCAKKKDGT